MFSLHVFIILQKPHPLPLLLERRRGMDSPSPLQEMGQGEVGFFFCIILFLNFHLENQLVDFYFFTVVFVKFYFRNQHGFFKIFFRFLN